MASRMTSPERRQAESDLLERLLGLYAQEEQLYTRVLALAAQQYEVIHSGSAIAAIRRILARKQSCLEEIGRLEAEESAARADWERRHGVWSPAGWSRLLAGRARITALIEEILVCEERNDRELIAQTAEV